MTLKGQPAPSFTLPDHNGQDFTLTPGQGKAIVLFFYPQSGSYGCTQEACYFRDVIAEKPVYDPAKVQVVGISGDSVQKQKAFVEKHKLTYPVLSDEKGEARKAYGVGKGLMGLTEARVTFIIDGKGIVRDLYDNVLMHSAHGKFATEWLAKLDAESKGESSMSAA